ncbi:uncharacterized protein [Hetaerina americana]|uniref:uncharacterized protein n=1 Tax=Hetaerina americana TaxID=62018 RepID=UPI003A7F26A6
MMAESPKDWTRLIDEVGEVKAILMSRGVTKAVDADGILNRLEKVRKESGRVNVVVSEIISELSSDEPEIVVVDDGEDSPEVELLYQNDNNANNSARQRVKRHKSPRGVKRHVANVPYLAPEDPKRAFTSNLGNEGGSETRPNIIENPVMDEIIVVPTENAALPEEMDIHAKQRDQLNYLRDLFPHIESEYLKIIVEKYRGDEFKLNAFVMDALENKFYPSIVQSVNEPKSKVPDETLPSCSKSVVTSKPVKVKNSPNIHKTSTPLVILEADSTTTSLQAEGAVGGVSRLNGSALVGDGEEISGASGYENDLNEETSASQNESEEKDDLEKSILYSEQLEYLIGVLPDADPSFLEDKISEFEGDAEKLKEFVTAALECHGGRRIYLTRGEIQQKQEHDAQVMKFTKNFSVEDFLEVFPDPAAHFENSKRVPDPKVRNHCIAYLKARYKSLYVNTVCHVFRKQNSNLSLTVKELDKDKYPKRKTKRSSNDCKLPQNQCISFLQEIAFIENKKVIADFIENKKKRRQQKFDEAKAKNELLTCNCCFDDELLTEDMSSCSDGHLFCIQCVKKGAEVLIGDGKVTFPCMQEDCKAVFSLPTLQGILAPSIFGKLVMRLQAEEVNAAGIEGLETCPSCPYSTIPAPEDKVFKCLNPECMKETCRSCKEPSHIPLKCEEVEKNEEVQARTYIENKMTEALIRTCWKCSRKFIKESGCNKMTCTCGALMCYICRKPVTGYQHFNPYKDRPSNLCPLYSDDVELHVRSVQTEAEKAKEDIMRQNPNVNLKHDPTLKLPEKPSSSKGPKHPMMNPFLIDDHDNPMDFFLFNVRDYFHGRFHDHRHDFRGHQYPPNVNVMNEFDILPGIRDYRYNIPPVYDVPPVLQVAPMPRNYVHVPPPPQYHQVRPYAPQNVLPYQMVVNAPMVDGVHMPVQERVEPVRHHVYPPPPERHASKRSSKR